MTHFHSLSAPDWYTTLRI